MSLILKILWSLTMNKRILGPWNAVVSVDNHIHGPQTLLFSKKCRQQASLHLQFKCSAPIVIYKSYLIAKVS